MNEKINNRPEFLSALCILSFIGSSISFIGYFLASLFFERASEWIVKYSSWSTTESISPLYFTVLMAVSALSLTGAIRIWKLHRDGFFLYSVAQTLLLLLPVVWINTDAFSSVNLIFVLLFIVGYGLNWKKLK